MKLEGCRISFLGDSITEGYRASDPSLVYWRRFEQDKAIVKGYGVAGTRIAMRRIPSPDPSFDETFELRSDQIDRDSDVIVIFGGTNDFGHGDAMLGGKDDQDRYTFCGALNCLADHLSKRFPNAQLVWMTPLHRNDEDSPFNEWGIKHTAPLSDYVDALTQMCQRKGFALLDLYHLSGLDPRDPVLRETYSPDGLHPNDAGMERIYTLLREFLISL